MAAKKPFEPDLPHPSVETRNLQPIDQKLRRNGFRIYSRPKQGPARWELIGTREIMTEGQALAYVEARVKALETGRTK